MRTRSVDKFLFRNYLTKAVEFSSTAKIAFEKGFYNAAVANSVHCSICAVDALGVFYKGVRHAGERHEDAVALLQTLPFEREELKRKTCQFSRLLSIKTAAEYNEQLMSRGNAGTALTDSGRILEWVKGILEG